MGREEPSGSGPAPDAASVSVRSLRSAAATARFFPSSEAGCRGAGLPGVSYLWVRPPDIVNIIIAIMARQPNAHSRAPELAAPVATSSPAMTIIGMQQTNIISLWWLCPPCPPWGDSSAGVCVP